MTESKGDLRGSVPLWWAVGVTDSFEDFFGILDLPGPLLGNLQDADVAYEYAIEPSACKGGDQRRALGVTRCVVSLGSGHNQAGGEEVYRSDTSSQVRRLDAACRR